ncbi:MAG: hypothetical protein WC326_14420 [Candidatus Delongbacteria bacterium]
MTTLDLRERQYRLIGWSTSLLVMALLWLLLAQLSVDRPRQGPAPTEVMLNWVRTIVPTPVRDRLLKARVRERTVRQIGRSAPRPLSVPDRAALRSAPRDPGALTAVPERQGRGLPDLPARGGARPVMPGRGRLLDGGDEVGGSGLNRGSANMNLRTEPLARRGGGAGAGSARGPRGELLSLPPQELDPVLARFMGVTAASLPGGTLNLGGQPWLVWVSEQGGLLRVLLRRGDELRLLVLAGADLQAQSFQRGEVSRARGGLVVQSQRSGAGEAAGLREDLLKALEDLE